MTMATNKINLRRFLMLHKRLWIFKNRYYVCKYSYRLTTLLGLVNSVPLNTIGAPDIIKVFTVPTTGNNLYLVYDYRNAIVPTPPTNATSL